MHRTTVKIERLPSNTFSSSSATQRYSVLRFASSLPHTCSKHAVNVQNNVLGFKLGRIQQYATANLLFTAQATLEQIPSAPHEPNEWEIAWQ